jgi:hypothetical protein
MTYDDQRKNIVLRRWLTEAHARATAVLVDELDSSRLEGVTDHDHERAI